MNERNFGQELMNMGPGDDKMFEINLKKWLSLNKPIWQVIHLINTISTQ